MKIYTKTGDNGSTSLASGKRVSKSNPFVEMYGTCDELNSSIGVSICFLSSNSKLLEPLIITQNLLFELGSELAGFRPKKEPLKSIIYETDINYLENFIDTLEENLPKMKSFVLPGGSKATSFLHVCRTICRRLERLMVIHKENNEEIFDNSLKYINRLSDFLFVAARFANHEQNIEDIKWTSRARNIQ